MLTLLFLTLLTIQKPIQAASLEIIGEHEAEQVFTSARVRARARGGQKAKALDILPRPRELASEADPVLGAKVFLGGLDDRQIYSLAEDAGKTTKALNGKLECPTEAAEQQKFLQAQIKYREARIAWTKRQAKTAKIDGKLPSTLKWTTAATNVQDLYDRWGLLYQFNLANKLTHEQIVTGLTKMLETEVKALKALLADPEAILHSCKAIELSCEEPTVGAGDKISTRDVAIFGGKARWVKIPSFDEKTGEAVNKTLNAKGRFESIVLDLRSTSRGLAAEAKKLAKGLATTKKTLTVLVDANTAGAGEEMVKELRKVGQNVVVAGDETFGSGLAWAKIKTKTGGVATLESEKFVEACGGARGGITPEIRLSSRHDSDPTARLKARMSVYPQSEYPKAIPALKDVVKDFELTATIDANVKQWRSLALETRDFFRKHPTIPLGKTFADYQRKKAELESSWKKLELADGQESTLDKVVAALTASQLKFMEDRATTVPKSELKTR